EHLALGFATPSLPCICSAQCALARPCSGVIFRQAWLPWLGPSPSARFLPALCIWSARLTSVRPASLLPPRKTSVRFKKQDSFRVLPLPRVGHSYSIRYTYSAPAHSRHEQPHTGRAGRR